MTAGGRYGAVGGTDAVEHAASNRRRRSARSPFFHGSCAPGSDMHGRVRGGWSPRTELEFCAPLGHVITNRPCSSSFTFSGFAMSSRTGDARSARDADGLVIRYLLWLVRKSPQTPHRSLERLPKPKPIDPRR